MKFSEIQQLANFYGFDLKDVSNIYPYSERKGQTIGISDRRTGYDVATYSKSNPKLAEYFQRFKLN
ncbi:MAG: hypothetical protein HC907_37010 [Richelia sp. SM1_7_0]|nr:hypothetical protein [Richelia sp. SM1_7_0]